MLVMTLVMATGAHKVLPYSRWVLLGRITRSAPELYSLLRADDADVIRHPLAVRNADVAATISTCHCGRAPEVNLVEVVDTVGLAAVLAEQVTGGAGIWYGRHGTEPRRHITLNLRIER